MCRLESIENRLTLVFAISTLHFFVGTLLHLALENTSPLRFIEPGDLEDLCTNMGLRVVTARRRQGSIVDGKRGRMRELIAIASRASTMKRRRRNKAASTDSFRQ